MARPEVCKLRLDLHRHRAGRIRPYQQPHDPQAGSSPQAMSMSATREKCFVLISAAVIRYLLIIVEARASLMSPSYSSRILQRTRIVQITICPGPRTNPKVHLGRPVTVPLG